MSPQIIAGQGSDLTKTIAQLVKELLENNWPTSAFDPLKVDIKFGLDTWDNYGDIQLHVNADKSTSIPSTLGWNRSQVMDTNLKDVWHAIGHASAIYFKVKV